MMKSRRGAPVARRSSLLVRSVMAGFGLASLATIQMADAQETPPEQCDQPITALNCKNARYRSCPGKEAACTPVLQSGFRSSFSSGVEHPRYEDFDDTQSTVPGKLLPRVLPQASLMNLGGFASYESMELRAQANAQASSVAPSPLHMRNPNWLKNGKAIESCAEYVYEKYYDYMRFVDAANSCKQDDSCVVNMAYAKPAGMIAPSNIVDREVSGRGEESVPLQPISLSNTIVPKNRFYPGAVLLTPRVRTVIDAAFPGYKSTIDHAVARAYGGRNYYRWGNVSSNDSPVLSYPNEFAFHKAMRTATMNVPVHEAEANLRRAKKFEETFSSFSAEAHCKGLSETMPKCMDLPVLRQKGLLERMGGDPWIRTHVLSNDVLRGQAMNFALEGKPVALDGAGGTFMPIEQYGSVNAPLYGGIEIGIPGGGGTGGNGGHTSQLTGPRLGSPTTNSLSGEIDFDPEENPSPLWQTGMAKDLEFTWSESMPVADATSPTPRLNCAVEADKGAYRMLACEGINEMLDEITRDNASCFDKSYYGCDWHPSMFAERFHRTQQYMAARTRDYNWCMRWTGDLFGSIETNRKDNYENLERYIDWVWSELKDFDAPRDTDASGKVIGFGESKSESKTLGDEASFGGGYSYHVGWYSKPVEYIPNTTKICRMDFTADASFNTWASTFNDPSELVGAEAHLKVNEDDDGNATLYRRLSILGNDLISGAEVQINHAGSSDLRGVDEDYELFDEVYPLPYGFYVHVEGGVELAAGATFLSTALTPAKGSCTGPEALSAGTGVNAYATASVYAAASGGWAGIIEAGLEANLDLIRADLPVVASGGVYMEDVPRLKFDLTGKLTLSTLSGSVDACGCFVGFCGCKEVASWPGENLGTVDLFTPIEASVPITAF